MHATVPKKFPHGEKSPYLDRLSIILIVIVVGAVGFVESSAKPVCKGVHVSRTVLKISEPFVEAVQNEKEFHLSVEKGLGK